MTSLALRNHDARAGVIGELRLAGLWRGEENLFAPDRAGGALAAGTSLVSFVVRSVQHTAEGQVETGDRWTRAVGSIGISVGM